MFDIAWGEFLVIGVVALIVIGPKELPGVLRAVGQWTTKIRRMAGEFQSQFQEALREAEMADLKKEVDTLTDTAHGFASSLNTPFDPIETEKWQPKDATVTAQADAAASGQGEAKPWEEEMAGLEPPFQSVTPPPEPPPPPQTFGPGPVSEPETVAADAHASQYVSAPAAPTAPPVASPAPSRVSEPAEPAPEKSGPA